MEGLSFNPNVLLSIGARRRDPLERLQKKATISAMRDAAMMRQLIAEARQRELDESAALSGALPELEAADYSPEAVVRALRANPAAATRIVTRADAIRKSRAEQDKLTAETGKIGAEAEEKRMKTRESAAKLLANQAFQLSNKKDLTPRDVEQWAKMVESNGLERLLPAPRFQDWSNPDAARKTLATAGSSLFEAHQQVEAGQKERKLQADIPHITAQTNKLALETEQMPRELAVKEGGLKVQQGNLGVSQGRLALERDQYNRPLLQHVGTPETGVFGFNPKDASLTPGAGPSGPVAPRVKLTEKQRNEISELKAEYDAVEEAIAKAKANPKAFDVQQGIASESGSMVASIYGRRYTPQENEARSAVYNTVSSVIKQRAGTAQSKQEQANIMRFMPSPYDGAGQIEDKFRAYQQYLKTRAEAFATPVPSVGGVSPVELAGERPPMPGPSAPRLPGIISITPTGR